MWRLNTFICLKLPKKEDGWDTTVYIWFAFFLHCNTPAFCLDNESDLKTYPDIGQVRLIPPDTRRIFVSVKDQYLSKDYESTFIVKVIKVKNHIREYDLFFEQVEQLKS
ncbi:hypothetical protein Bca4012_082327 [Brassica carinata]